MTVAVSLLQVGRRKEWQVDMRLAYLLTIPYGHERDVAIRLCVARRSLLMRRETPVCPYHGLRVLQRSVGREKQEVFPALTDYLF